MAKLRNRTMQRKQSKVAEKRQKDGSALKKDMQQLMEANDYATALEVMAEIAGTGRMDAETMYWGAKCYFLLGDYDRALRWLDNVLGMQAGYIPAKALLAALCIAQKRYEDGLRLCEYVLTKHEEQLVAEDKELLENALKYVAAMQKVLFKDYPACRNCLGITDEAANALAKLRKLMGNVKQGESFAQVKFTDEITENDCGMEMMAEAADRAEPEGAKEQPCMAEATEKFDTDKVVTDIMSRKVSLRDKIKLFNAFAAGCYQAGDYQAAFELLSAALRLDTHDDMILKNAAYTCIAAGEKEQALKYVAKMNRMDFELLHVIKNS